MPRMTNMYVRVDELRESDFDGETVLDVIEKLKNILENVPEEHRSKVVFDLDTYDGLECNLVYYREETEAEYEQRLADVVETAAKHRAQVEAEERATFERLKAKYDR